jgi:hypothetical protein
LFGHSAWGHLSFCGNDFAWKEFQGRWMGWRFFMAERRLLCDHLPHDCECSAAYLFADFVGFEFGGYAVRSVGGG